MLLAGFWVSNAALYFAHVTSLPERRYGSIYDRDAQLPRQVAQYTVRYADGSPLLKAAWAENIEEAGRILRNRRA